MIDIKPKRPLILASGSPRRKELMSTLGFNFEILVSDVDEDFPEKHPAEEVPGLLSDRKARAILELRPEALVLAADTIVVSEGKILNKPGDSKEAAEMLKMLSGKTHNVVTAFTLASFEKVETITDQAAVIFKTLSPKEIDYYLAHGKPFDKAGAYGIQEWIGLIGVEKIFGSYFTVMGLPTHLVWNQLMKDYLVWSQPDS